MAAERQGSRDAVRAFTGGAGCVNDDERADEHFPCLQTCRCGAGAGKSCPGPFRRVGRQPMRSNEDPRERAVVWQRSDDAQAGCTRMCIEVAWPQPLWIRTELVGARGASSSQRNSACWCSNGQRRDRVLVLGATAIDESSRVVRTEGGRRMRADERTRTPATADPDARPARKGGEATPVRMCQHGGFRRSRALSAWCYAAGLFGRRRFSTPGR